MKVLVSPVFYKFLIKKIKYYESQKEGFMRTVTLIIVLFIIVLLFFEVTDWTPKVPTTKEVTKEKTVIVETVEESGEVVNTTIIKESTTATQENQ